MKNKGTLWFVGIGFGALLAALIFYLYQSSVTDVMLSPATQSDESDTGGTSAAIIQSETQLTPTHVPEGWKVYSNNELNRVMGGIAFAYPAHWDLEILPTGAVPDTRGSNIGGIIISGDGYRITMGGHGGLPSGMEATHDPYIIDGLTTKTWQRDAGDHYEQIIVAGEFSFRIKAPGKDTELSDRILSTINLSKW